MERATSFAPGHITGFFYICDEDADPLRKGSRGAGFSIEKGVTAEVRRLANSEARESNPEISVRINGKPRRDAVVSIEAARLVLARAREKGCDGRGSRITIDEEIEVPEGSGFGTSGAGALSVAYALNELLDGPLSRDECGQAAHCAEINCRTGLGSVIAEAAGGCEIRREPGAPGIGRVERFARDEEWEAACLTYGPLSTRSMLSDEKTRTRINEAGRSFFAEFLRAPSVAEFLRVSRGFAEATGLISDRVRRIMGRLDDAGLPCGMPMFGEGVFMLFRPEENERARAIVDASGEKKHLVMSKIDLGGGRVINVA